MLKNGDIQGNMHSSGNPVPPSVVKKDRDIFVFFHFRNLVTEHDTADYIEPVQCFCDINVTFYAPTDKIFFSCAISEHLMCYNKYKSERLTLDFSEYLCYTGKVRNTLSEI